MIMKKKNDCPKSRAMTKEFLDYFPVAHSNMRIKVSAQNYRLFIDHGQGARLYDVDGNEYIDYCISYGPTALGSVHPELSKALIDLIETRPTASFFFSEDDIRLGELIRKNVPNADRIKMAMTGTEAVQVAIRIARAYTGKKMILKFAECFHGWIDNVFGGDYNPSPSGMPVMTVKEDDHSWCPGLSEVAREETLVIPFNDFNILEDTFEKYGHLIAICHFEAVPINGYSIQPKPGFIEKIRELCTKYNVVMSMDEVLTGFRVGPGGAQELFGIKPDLATFGKMFAGGVASAFVCGVDEVMRVLPEENVLSAGTFNGWPLAQRAAATTIDILTRNNGQMYKDMYAKQETIMDGIVELAEKYGFKVRISENPGCFYTIFGVEGGRKPIYSFDEIKNKNDAQNARFRTIMEDNGVLILPENRWLMCFVLTNEDVQWTLEAAEESLKQMVEEGLV